MDNCQLGRLNNRQKQCPRLFDANLAIKEIAAELGLSPYTVREHLRRLRKPDGCRELPHGAEYRIQVMDIPPGCMKLALAKPGYAGAQIAVTVEGLPVLAESCAARRRTMRESRSTSRSTGHARRLAGVAPIFDRARRRSYRSYKRTNGELP